MRSRVTAGVVSTLLCTFALAAPAHAAFPGANGKIAFVRGGDIWTMNPDGGGQVNLTNSTGRETDPAWSADGTRIVFVDSDRQISVMVADGSQVTKVRGGVYGEGPSFSPTGTEIAFGYGGS